MAERFYTMLYLKRHNKRWKLNFLLFVYQGDLILVFRDEKEAAFFIIKNKVRETTTIE